MNLRFIMPDNSDRRIAYAKDYLEKYGMQCALTAQNADFILLGVNPDKGYLSASLPIFAGNIRAENVFDYTKNEAFALFNAYLTAESAVALAAEKSESSLIGADILIAGYGRIGAALHRYLAPYSGKITVCARNENARAKAQCCQAKAISFQELTDNSTYDYIFNTVPFPVFTPRELSTIRNDTLIMDLASFPGGVDKHYAEVSGQHLVIARGLPAKFAPRAAGKAVAEAVISMTREVFI